MNHNFTENERQILELSTNALKDVYAELKQLISNTKKELHDEIQAKEPKIENSDGLDQIQSQISEMNLAIARLNSLFSDIADIHQFNSHEKLANISIEKRIATLEQFMGLTRGLENEFNLFCKELQDKFLSLDRANSEVKQENILLRLSSANHGKEIAEIANTVQMIKGNYTNVSNEMVRLSGNLSEIKSRILQEVDLKINSNISKQQSSISNDPKPIDTSSFISMSEFNNMYQNITNKLNSIGMDVANNDLRVKNFAHKLNSLEKAIENANLRLENISLPK